MVQQEGEEKQMWHLSSELWLINIMPFNLSVLAGPLWSYKYA